MGSFAKIDENNIVIQVISCEEETAKLLPEPETWIQTSRNTIGGVHLEGGTPLRMNYAAIGSFYDKDLDIFIPAKFNDSFVLDKTTYTWVPPIPKPSPKDGYDYRWDITTESWIEELIPPDESA
jgi:hypothetical protein